jgi:hypothetical protein
MAFMADHGVAAKDAMIEGVEANDFFGLGLGQPWTIEVRCWRSRWWSSCWAFNSRVEVSECAVQTTGTVIGSASHHGYRWPLPRFAHHLDQPSLLQPHQRSTGGVAFDIKGLEGFLRKLEGLTFGHAVQPPQRNADIQGLTR